MVVHRTYVNKNNITTRYKNLSLCFMNEHKAAEHCEGRVPSRGDTVYVQTETFYYYYANYKYYFTYQPYPC
ncbi:hypothetical protein CLV24_1246 [Pontibacter ummariensis]|uniref:Uncharacterized protein n=1 Tax=Pontibacter ummariensis TaxID=1610492 RepID=A0A239JYG0_9BACT|nr:hypothetical protein CLV24_1246 [Pontibacter ummariensis]SNT10825.1 hypothetical protein SAMN06296052_12458 [Pontibacter ummariensis]